MKLIYIGQYYVPNAPERAVELKKCLDYLCQNVCIDEQYYLNEKNEEDVAFYCQKKSHIHQIVIGERITFQTVLNFASNSFENGDIVVFGNADIYFEQTVSILKFLPQKTSAVITRHDICDGHVFPPSKTNDCVPAASQDVWALRMPLLDNLNVKNCNFFFGVPGCDNRFAYELCAAGYYLWNPAYEIRAYHMHANQERAYHVRKDAIAPPYFYIAPHSLETHLKIRAAWPAFNPFEIGAVVHSYVNNAFLIPIDIWITQIKSSENSTLFYEPQSKTTIDYCCALFLYFGSRYPTMNELDTVNALLCSGISGDTKAKQFVREIFKRDLSKQKPVSKEDQCVEPDTASSNSPEWIKYVESAYLRILYRNADRKGLKNYTEKLEKGQMTIKQFEKTLLDSTERRQTLQQAHWQQYERTLTLCNVQFFNEIK